MEKIIRIKIYILLFVFCSLFFTPFVIHAASLNISPASATRTVGSTFDVTVFVSSPDKAVNVATGVLSYPTDKLEVLGLSKVNSIMNHYVQESTFSNAQGNVIFEGIVFNPGYTGTRGTVIIVKFRAKAVGVANVNFVSGSVLANDGAGTEVLSGLNSGTFTIIDTGEVLGASEVRPVKVATSTTSGRSVLGIATTTATTARFAPCIITTAPSTYFDNLSAFLILLMLLLLLLLIYYSSRTHYFMNKIHKEAKDANLSLHNSFAILRKEIKGHVELLGTLKTKRNLTEEEDKIFNDLKNHLNATEKFIEKEIEDVEKVVRKFEV